MSENKQSKVVQIINEFVAGSIGGMCGVVTGHPMDTIRVRLQTQSRTKVKIDVVRCNTICDVKTKILKWFKPDQIGRVSVGAVTLKDDETLQQYDIKTGDTINVFLT